MPRFHCRFRSLAPASALWIVAPAVVAQPSATPDVEALCRAVEPRVVEWRRDLHRHPEPSNRELRTDAKVAEHLRSLGIEVETDVRRSTIWSRGAAEVAGR